MQSPTAPDSPLAGKNALVTGGSTGIGRAIAHALARKGAKVMICGRDQSDLDEALEGLPLDQGELLGVIADVGELAGVTKLFRELDEAFGTIDILVNNAAVAAGSAADMPLEEIDYVVRTNLLGYLTCAHEAVARMRASGGGALVNIGSMSAETREKGSSVYVATKAAVRGFSGALRKEVNPDGIAVALIEPGKTGSDMQPHDPEEQRELQERGEMLTAEDVAEAVLFCLLQPKRSSVVEVQIRPLHQLI
jgi:NADP-dependent 3-hydroxy acid dehydrogenase YdfG